MVEEREATQLMKGEKTRRTLAKGGGKKTRITCHIQRALYENTWSNLPLKTVRTTTEECQGPEGTKTLRVTWSVTSLTGK